MASDWTEFDEAAVTALFFLGHRPGREDQPIVYPRNADDRAHLAYYGTTKSGKTHAIEYVLQQLARDRSAGFCYIDPHGSSYWRMASYLRQHEITDRVLYWDINDPEFVVTYDPLSLPGQSSAYIAGNLTTALLATLGRDADAHEQPHLKTLTESAFSAMLELHLPFAFARHVFDPDTRDIKEAMEERLTQSNMLTTVGRQPLLRDRIHDLGAPFRRVDNLFRDDRLRLTFTAAGLNFRQLMDEGWIVLVNTEPKDQTDEAATLFTRLLVKHLFMAAKTREAADDPPPFFLVIDEASRYLTTDTAQILAQTAKYGLYLVLGMQSIEQARRENEESYVAIRTTVNAEVVLRLRDYEEKLYFARRFFGDYFDFRSIKHEEEQTIAIPRSVPHTTAQVSHPLGPTQSVTRLATGEETSTEAYSPDVEVEGEGWHVEYDYDVVKKPIFSTPDELERLAARRFSLRAPGRAQRFGVAQVNEAPPSEIEVPELQRPLYSRAEMVEYLREVKATQPATLPRVEAARRFDDLIRQTLNSLLKDDAAVKNTTERKKRTRTKKDAGADPEGPRPSGGFPRDPFRGD